MELWAELFSDWVGILSFGVIAFVIVIAIFMYRFVTGHTHDDAAD
ncbi:MAG: DUF3149 domain-containing protein [Chromatiales bacterium]|jgi:hypothetical protein